MAKKSAALGNEKARMEQAYRDEAAFDRIRYQGEHPPCRRCNGPNDMLDVCAKCGEELKAEGYDPFFTSKYSDNGR